MRRQPSVRGSGPEAAAARARVRIARMASAAHVSAARVDHDRENVASRSTAADADARSDGAALLSHVVQRLERTVLAPCGGPLGEALDRDAVGEAAARGAPVDQSVTETQDVEIPPCRSVGPLKVMRLWALWSDQRTGAVRRSWSAAIASLSALLNELTPPLPPETLESYHDADEVDDENLVSGEMYVEDEGAARDADSATDTKPTNETQPDASPPPPPPPPRPPVYLVLICNTPLLQIDERDPEGDVGEMSGLGLGGILLDPGLDGSEEPDGLKEGLNLDARDAARDDTAPSATNRANSTGGESPATVPVRCAHAFEMRPFDTLRAQLEGGDGDDPFARFDAEDAARDARKRGIRVKPGVAPDPTPVAGLGGATGGSSLLVAAAGQPVGHVSAEAHARVVAASAEALREHGAESNGSGGGSSSPESSGSVGRTAATAVDAPRAGAENSDAPEEPATASGISGEPEAPLTVKHEQKSRRRALGFSQALCDLNAEEADARLAHPSAKARAQLIGELLRWIAAADTKRGEVRHVVLVGTSRLRSAQTVIEEPATGAKLTQVVLCDSAHDTAAFDASVGGKQAAAGSPDQQRSLDLGHGRTATYVHDRWCRTGGEAYGALTVGGDGALSTGTGTSTASNAATPETSVSSDGPSKAAVDEVYARLQVPLREDARYAPTLAAYDRAIKAVRKKFSGVKTEIAEGEAEVLETFAADMRSSNLDPQALAMNRNSPAPVSSVSAVSASSEASGERGSDVSQKREVAGVPNASVPPAPPPSIRASLGLLDSTAIGWSMPRLLLGPVVGDVTETCATIMLEIDRSATVGLMLRDALTGECFHARRAAPARRPFALKLSPLRPARRCVHATERVTKRNRVTHR